jgi:3-deoxy-D-manno-octulosonate 8-phosphate phosphatase (KDO 8-P phosphatase)
MPQLTQRFDPQLLLRAQDIKLLLLDVDGVLTDGQLVYSNLGEEHKVFNSLDGQGLVYVRESGIALALISGRESGMVKRRAADLGMAHVYMGVKDKLPVAEKLLEKLKLGWHQTAAMGDDWPDVPLLSRAALAAAPCNAHIEVQQIAQLVTAERGGQGAVRTLCDLLLTANGHYRKRWESLA